jgi:anti-repressor protein
MNDLLKVDLDKQTISARELHERLKINTRFNDWFPRMVEYGFSEGLDFYSKMSKTENCGRPSKDYEISVDMAKQICMIQRTPEGKQCRQYLIDLEKAWNTPEQVMARALKMADGTINRLKEDNAKLLDDNRRMKPKEIFADAVSASDSSMLVRDVAKMIRQNGVQLGEKRFYKWLREKGYICQGSTVPTQKAMELGLFEIVVRTVERGNGLPLETKTTKITGKGQQYFINKFLCG